MEYGVQHQIHQIEGVQRRFTKDYYYYLLKAYSPVNRTESPQGFSQVQVLHKSKYNYNKHLINIHSNKHKNKKVWT